MTPGPEIKAKLTGNPLDDVAIRRILFVTNWSCMGSNMTVCSHLLPTPEKHSRYGVWSELFAIATTHVYVNPEGGAKLAEKREEDPAATSNGKLSTLNAKEPVPLVVKLVIESAIVPPLATENQFVRTSPRAKKPKSVPLVIDVDSPLETENLLEDKIITLDSDGNSARAR
jgi:hypothetical protein